jgi:cell division septation protein DedD
VASQAHDDGFHEIQLNGKQLVFLFMAATVVSVVIFLCGVLVGRGVRAERTAVAEAAAGTEPLTADPAPAVPPVAAAPATDPSTTPPPTAAEDLSYYDRLETKTQPSEDLKPSDDKARAKSEQVVKPAETAKRPSPPPDAPAARASTAAAAPSSAARPAAAASQNAPASSAAKDPRSQTARAADASPGPGYAVQVAALNVRSEADAIAARLSAKGYQAYVQTPSNGTPAVYRVRIGTFKTRREAENVAAKLQKEEQFKPWVTR